MVNPKSKAHIASFQLLVSCVLCLLSIAVKANPTDSLRLETINGKQFIIHQVDPKETLYSISRRYGVAVASLREENPGVDAGLTIGQQLKVPYVPKGKAKAEGGVVTHKVAPKETLFSISKLYDVSVDDIKTWNNLKDNALSAGQDLVIRKKIIVETAKLPEQKAIRGMHKVVEKETLYSISRTYGASVDQLKTWNNLTSDEVKPGQILYVIQPMYMQEKAQTVQQNETKQTEIKQTQVTKPSADVKISESVIGSDEVHEKGAAGLIDGTDGNRKYLAQHKTAKVGTIMKVRNETTNREVFVRVVGPLIADGNTVIKVSRSAFDRLGATDPNFNVELIYYK